MITIDETKKNIQTEEMTRKRLVYYSHHQKELTGSVSKKAAKFFELKLVRWDPDMGVYYVDPIKGYNTRTYTVEKVGKGFECNCQGCQTKIKTGKYDPKIEDKNACAHIGAVWLLIKWRNMKR